MSVKFREFRDKAKRNRVGIDGRIDHIQHFIVDHLHAIPVRPLKTVATIIYRRLSSSEKAKLKKYGYQLGEAAQEAVPEPTVTEPVVPVSEEDIHNGDHTIAAAEALVEAGLYPDIESAILAIVSRKSSSKSARRLQKAR